ncbi:uncharacterized protein LOC131847267 isoform X2 [Achroia grisella]|uniref:uncharacterized protein LOC131847267 isoform X2 n=1 Tax=Achroia grisella TaxID=688607 RepID=UPI0027D24BF3|nr:uncharacterized protein LOC131847267 isoform X2 [Achroia grisella]
MSTSNLIKIRSAVSHEKVRRVAISQRIIGERDRQGGSGGVTGITNSGLRTQAWPGHEQQSARVSRRSQFGCTTSRYHDPWCGVALGSDGCEAMIGHMGRPRAHHATAVDRHGRQSSMHGGKRRGAAGGCAGRLGGAKGTRVARRAGTAARAHPSSTAAATKPRARRGGIHYWQSWRGVTDTLVRA